MADFPNEGHQSSRISYFDERIVSRARSGAVKVRVLQSGKKRIFTVVLRGLSSTERDTLMTFYDNNRDGAFTYLWTPTNETVTVVFAANQIEWEKEADRYHTVVTLWEI
jgi:hypothetical protein